jgi:hypothetical protein
MANRTQREFGQRPGEGAHLHKPRHMTFTLSKPAVFFLTAVELLNCSVSSILAIPASSYRCMGSYSNSERINADQ